MAEVGAIKFGADVQGLKEAKQALDEVRESGGKTARSANEIIKLMAEQSRITKALANDAERLKVKLGEQAIAAEKAGISTGQYNNALRMVPAQITDIVTQLQGGQNPFTILIQQGGQLRDSFGSVRATLGAFANMINPTMVAFGALAGVVGGAVFVMEKQARAQGELSNALIATGNASGATVPQLQNLTAELKRAGVSAGDAQDSLVALVKAGIPASQTFGEMAEAAAKFSKESGQPLEDVLKTYQKINDDPVAGLIAMAKNFNNVTAEQLAHINALEDAGQHTQALAEANKIAANSFEGMADKMNANLSPIQQLIRDITDGAKSMWDAITGAGNGDALTEQIAWQKKQLADAESANWLEKKFISRTPEQIRNDIRLLERTQALQKSLLDVNRQGEETNRNNFNIKAETLKLEEKSMTAAEKREANAKRVNGLVKHGLVDAKLAAEQIAAFDKANPDKKTAKAKTTVPGVGRSITQNVEVNTDLLTMQARIEFAKQWTPLQDKMTREQVKYLDIVNRNKLIEDQLREGKITLAQAEKIRASTATISAAKELSDSSQILQSIEKRNAAMQKAIKFEQQQAAVRSRYSTEVLSLGKREQDMRVQQDRIRQDETLTDEARQKMLESLQETFDAESEAHDNMIAGFNSGMADYFDTSTNYMAQVHDATLNVFNGMSDVVTTFVTKGKADFKGFVTSVLADFARIATNKALSSLFQIGMSFFGPSSTPSMVQAGPTMANGRFAEGGFTGGGGKYEPAGVVHKGEFVMPQEATNRIGVNTLYAMMRNKRGYADGGLVGGNGARTGGDINVGVNVQMQGQTSTGSSRDSAVQKAVADTVDLSVRMGINTALQPGGAIFMAMNAR